MKARIAVAAESISRDADTGAISAFQILEGIAAQGFPLLMTRVAFFVLWEREDGDPPVNTGTVSVRLNERQLLSHGVSIDFADKRKNRSVFRFEGLVLPSVGVLSFVQDMGSAGSAEYSVEVVKAGEAEVVVLTSAG
jgi:hypothetical protein